MKTLTLFFALLALAPAQKTTTHTLHFTAGTIHCTFTSYFPPALTGLHVECITPTGSVKLDTPLTPAPYFGALYSDQDSLTWTFEQSSRGVPALYKIVANGKLEVGSL